VVQQVEYQYLNKRKALFQRLNRLYGGGEESRTPVQKQLPIGTSTA